MNHNKIAFNMFDSLCEQWQNNSSLVLSEIKENSFFAIVYKWPTDDIVDWLVS
jgi:hypothetical protein